MTTKRDGANGQLRRQSFVTLYFQLAEVLKERLEAGEWRPGERFMSDRELCSEFGVSRTVVRPALEMLEGDGSSRASRAAERSSRPRRSSTASAD